LRILWESYLLVVAVYFIKDFDKISTFLILCACLSNPRKYHWYDASLVAITLTIKAHRKTFQKRAKK